MVEHARRHVGRGADSGRIVNVSTEGAYCFPSEISYGASKLALDGFSRSAAWELGQFGVTVNVVSLGPIQTGWITPVLEKELIPKIPMGRIGTRKDVADVIVFPGVSPGPVGSRDRKSMWAAAARCETWQRPGSAWRDFTKRPHSGRVRSPNRGYIALVCSPPRPRKIE